MILKVIEKKLKIKLVEVTGVEPVSK